MAEAATDREDTIRARLLDAATRVFARQGYAGTRILDIVREAGLSTGAVYGRFRSKEELLREAVVSRSTRPARIGLDQTSRVADLLTRGASIRRSELSDDDAVRLEAYIAARREPAVASALAEAHETWRRAVQPLVDAALADGTVAPDVDPEAVLFLVQTMHLGLLLQRGAGAAPPDSHAWNDLMSRIIASFGRSGERMAGTAHQAVDAGDAMDAAHATEPAHATNPARGATDAAHATNPGRGATDAAHATNYIGATNHLGATRPTAFGRSEPTILNTQPKGDR